MKKNKNLNEKILDNIEKDRKNTEIFLENINSYLEQQNLLDKESENEDSENKKYLSINGEDYSKIMMSAAKLIETSAKSNEQIIKLLEINKKNKPKKKEDDKLTKEEISMLISQEKHVVEI